MERPPHRFDGITYFAVRGVEKFDPRLDEVEKLTLEIGCGNSSERHLLCLIGPFPPFGRPGNDLDRLASLRGEDIESIWAFPKPDDRPWCRIEIRARVHDDTMFVRCDQIHGVPDWTTIAPQSERSCE
jgi:hypothetical protein